MLIRKGKCLIGATVRIKKQNRHNPCCQPSVEQVEGKGRHIAKAPEKSFG